MLCKILCAIDQAGKSVIPPPLPWSWFAHQETVALALKVKCWGPKYFSGLAGAADTVHASSIRPRLAPNCPPPLHLAVQTWWCTGAWSRLRAMHYSDGWDFSALQWWTSVLCWDLHLLDCSNLMQEGGGRGPMIMNDEQRTFHVVIIRPILIPYLHLFTVYIDKGRPWVPLCWSKLRRDTFGSLCSSWIIVTLETAPAALVPSAKANMCKYLCLFHELLLLWRQV